MGDLASSALQQHLTISVTVWYSHFRSSSGRPSAAEAVEPAGGACCGLLAGGGPAAIAAPIPVASASACAERSPGTRATAPWPPFGPEGVIFWREIPKTVSEV